MDILKLNQKNQLEIIKTAVNALKKGQLIVYPTETCFGLGADATNKKAIDKVFQFKGERNKPISIAVNGQKMAKNYVKLNPTAKNLYQNFLPGALTVISHSKNKVVDRLESTRNTLGIRIPDFPFMLKLIHAFGKPITATSANISNGKVPYSLKNFQRYTSKKNQDLISLFIDPGDLQERETSTVVDTTLNELKILRRGQIDPQQNKIEQFISTNELQTRKFAKKTCEKYLNPKGVIIFALQGNLGVGKTQFAKGIAEALKIKEPITSPTFTLIKEYFFGNNKLKTFYHLDTWRLEDGKEILELGLGKMLVDGNMVAIEWLEKVKETLQNIAKQRQAKIIWIKIEETNRKERLISIYE